MPPQPYIPIHTSDFVTMQATKDHPRLMEQYAMHDLTSDERVTCESMLANEPSSKVLVMPTHHINELGDMMGFRFVTLEKACYYPLILGVPQVYMQCFCRR